MAWLPPASLSRQNPTGESAITFAAYPVELAPTPRRAEMKCDWMRDDDRTDGYSATSPRLPAKKLPPETLPMVKPDVPAPEETPGIGPAASWPSTYRRPLVPS